MEQLIKNLWYQFWMQFCNVTDDLPVFDLQLTLFVSISDEERQKLLDARQSSNTRQQTKSYLKILGDYLREKSLPKLEEHDNAALPEMLSTFYANVRKEDGDFYKLQSLKCIRTSINWHLKETRNIDIIADPRFVQSNQMFKAMSVETKHQGKAVTVPKKVIEKMDMETIANHFSYDHSEKPDPHLLQ